MSSPPSAAGNGAMLDIDTSDATAVSVDAVAHDAAVSGVAQATGGVLLSWGCGMMGLLGGAADDETNRGEPTVAAGLAQRAITSVAAGSAHALAVGADSSLYSWGSNDEGQRGLGRADRTPTAVSEVTALQTKVVVGSATGYAHSLALTRGGEVFAFGAGEMAQLGLTLKKRAKGTPPDLSAHPTPSLVRELAALTRVVAVACGENHSLALSSAGRVYSCGDGSRGSLGLDLHRPSVATPDEGGVRVAVFTELTSLLPIPISSLAAGAHHSLFVAAGGSVYSCGDGGKGRLGYAVSSSSAHAVQWLPRRITGALDDKHVVAAAAGTQYSLFLTQEDHAVWGTGSNAHGELGRDPATVDVVSTPTRIEALPPIVQLSGGATHALARDASNRVWSWGSGDLGELGWGAAVLPKRSLTPGIVALPRLFPHQHVVAVAAGSNTSFAIIAQTIVAKSGDAAATTTPRPTPIASDSNDQAQTPASYQLYTPTRTHAFDFDKSSAVSHVTPDLTSAATTVPQYIVPPRPSPVPLAAFSYSHFSSLLRQKEYASLTQYVSHCFSSALILNASFLPSASVGGGSYIDTTLLEAVYQAVLKTSLTYPKIQQALTAALQRMVATMVLLLKQPARQPPKDLCAYRCIFIAFQSPHLLHASMSETQVLSDISYVLTRIPRDVLQTRILDYLYAHIPLSLLRERFIKVLVQNAQRRLRAMLGSAAANNRLRTSSEEVQDLVKILDGIHTSVMKRQERRLIEDGTAAEAPIPDSAWYLDVQSYQDLASDISAYVSLPPTAAQLPPFAFMRYPYLLSPATKVAYLRTEFAFAAQHEALGAMLSNLAPHLELKIRRSHLIDDTVNALNRHSSWELRRPLKVIFAGEAGEDQGGLTAEYFLLLFQQLFLPQYQLWEVRKEWKTFWFSSRPMDPSKASLYEIFGMLLGLCVYNGSATHLNLPNCIYAQLLGIKPTLADLKALDSQLAQSLEELLRFEGDVENTFCLTHEITIAERTDEEIDEEILATTAQMAATSVYAANSSQPNDHLAAPNSEAAPMQVDDGESAAAGDASTALSASVSPAGPRRVRTVALLPGGEDIPVTQANKARYVELYLEYLFTTSVSEQLDALIAGFQSIVGRVRGRDAAQRLHTDTASMGLFTPADLELLVVGRKDLSFADLRRGTRYEGGYSADHPTIRDFWSVVLEDLTPKEQSQLLVFTTGSSRAPVGGLAEVRLLIQRASPDSDNLPTSSTCFHALLLPQYSSKQKLKEKLQIALANAVGFGLR